MEEGRDSVASFIQERTNLDVAPNILSNLRSIINTLKLPKEILKRNRGVDVRLQQRLANHFLNLDRAMLENIIPRKPFAEMGYRVLNNIFDLCDKLLSIRNRGSRYRYFTLIAHRWIKEQSLREMIREEIEYKERINAAYDVNTVIRDLVDALNEQVRFHYAKTVKCFCDLLLFEIERRGITLEAYTLADFRLPSYIELGMHREGTIQLHSAGLSRTTAIEVHNYCRRQKVPEEKVLSWVKENANSIALQMERPIMVEIRRFFA